MLVSGLGAAGLPTHVAFPEIAGQVSDDRAHRVRLHVRDSGPDLYDRSARTVEPFMQADQRLTQPHAGVGLGLAASCET